MLGITVQIVFACFIYAVFMAWNFLFVDPVDDSLEVTEEYKKSDLEKGQTYLQRVQKYWAWTVQLESWIPKTYLLSTMLIKVKYMVENCNYQICK